MVTFYVVLQLLLFGTISTFVTVYILNIAGSPGVLLAGNPRKRNKLQLFTGVLVSALCQSYVYLAYTAFIVGWSISKINTGEVIPHFVWLFAFLAVAVPIIKTAVDVRFKQKESDRHYKNPMDEGIMFTLFITLVTFFIFVLVPNSMHILWGWVPYVDYYYMPVSFVTK